MEFKLYKKANNKLVLCDVLEFKSVVWEEKFNAVGRVQAVFPKNEMTMNAVQVGRFALISDTTDMMYIYGIKMTDDEIWAYGYEAKALLQKCGVSPVGLMHYGTVSDLGVEIAAMIGDFNEISVISDAAIIPALGSGNADSLEFYDVYDFITQVCALKKAGWYCSYNEMYGVLIPTVRQSVDRSDSVIFSRMLGNATGVNYTYDDQSYRNVVITIGIDEVTDPDNPEVVYGRAENIRASEDRMTAILDLRTEFPRTDDMTRADYESSLNYRAQMSLISRHTAQTIKVGSIDASELNVRYMLGDYVKVLVPEYNVSAKMCVNGVTRKLEGGQEEVTLTLSSVAG